MDRCLVTWSSVYVSCAGGYAAVASAVRCRIYTATIGSRLRRRSGVGGFARALAVVVKARSAEPATQAGGNGCWLVIASAQARARLGVHRGFALLARCAVEKSCMSFLGAAHSVCFIPCACASGVEQASKNHPLHPVEGLTQGLEREEQVCWCSTCVARHTCDECTFCAWMLWGTLGP